QRRRITPRRSAWLLARHEAMHHATPHSDDLDRLPPGIGELRPFPAAGPDRRLRCRLHAVRTRLIRRPRPATRYPHFLRAFLAALHRDARAGLGVHDRIGTPGITAGSRAVTRIMPSAAAPGSEV